MYGDVLKINSNEIKDKIYACWCGKNIGGTLGAPYEGKAQLNDIKGFANKPGEVIPNDDLDLQLAWLCAIEAKGPYNMSSKILAEYWIDLIAPHWSEYGICKGNLESGIMPSASGELNNDKWKDSNGAWIRSEIWACLAPGLPQIAVRYAYMDACVDHGKGEGTYAALLTTAMESIAFRESDIKKIIEEALRLKAEDIEIIFMTPNMMNTGISVHLHDEDFLDIAKKNAMMQNEGVFDAHIEAARRLCGQYGIPVCDCYSIWRKLDESGVDVTELLSNKINHPTREMNKIFAQELIRTMFLTEK